MATNSVRQVRRHSWDASRPHTWLVGAGLLRHQAASTVASSAALHPPHCDQHPVFHSAGPAYYTHSGNSGHTTMTKLYSKHACWSHSAAHSVGGSGSEQQEEAVAAPAALYTHTRCSTHAPLLHQQLHTQLAIHCSNKQPGLLAPAAMSTHP
jgi:hypothetical protein